MTGEDERQPVRNYKIFSRNIAIQLWDTAGQERSEKSFHSEKMVVFHSFIYFINTGIFLGGGGYTPKATN